MSEYALLPEYEMAFVQEGWVDALDWVLKILNDEIDYQERREGFKAGWNPDDPAPVPVSIVSVLERIHTIVSRCRKGWMLHG